MKRLVLLRRLAFREDLLLPYLRLLSNPPRSFSSTCALADGSQESKEEFWMGVVCLFSLGLQTPSKELLKPLKTTQSTFLEGVWSPRVSGC